MTLNFVVNIQQCSNIYGQYLRDLAWLANVVMVFVYIGETVRHHRVHPTGCLDKQQEPFRCISCKRHPWKTDQFRLEPRFSPGRRCNGVTLVFLHRTRKLLRHLPTCGQTLLDLIRMPTTHHIQLV